MKATHRIFCFLLLFSLLFTSSLQAISPTVTAAELESEVTEPLRIYDNDEIVPGQVLVKYKSSPPSGIRAHAVGSELTALTFSEEISVEEKLKELHADTNVEYAEPVFKIKAASLSSLTAVTQSVYYSDNVTYRNNWGKSVTEAAYGVSQTTEAERAQVRVAVLDSGIDMAHPDLIPAIVPGAGFDYINQDMDPQDDNGHGTHVAGIIAAGAASSSGYSGVAPGVKLIPIKVLDQNGNGTTTSLINGIDRAIAAKADIINLSLGLSSDSYLLYQAVRKAIDNDILVVASAGNESNHWIGNEPGQLHNSEPKFALRYAALTAYPARYDEVISVGAMAQISSNQFTIADFSNVGKVDIMAPGVNIFSTYPGSTYAYYSGTSQAAPFIAGMAALLKAYNPDLTAADLQTLIRMSGSSSRITNQTFNQYQSLGIGEVSFNEAYGSGMANGRLVYEVPRVKISSPANAYNDAGAITIQAKLINLRNETVPTNTILSDKLTLFVRGWNETADPEFNREQDSYVMSEIYPITGSDMRITLQLPAGTSTEAYKHYITSAWNGRTLDGVKIYNSNQIRLLKRPKAPVASLPSNTYEGPRNVTLSSEHAGARIYYDLYDISAEEPALTASGLYDSNHPISVTKNSVLFATILFNNVWSTDAVYEYVIKPVTPVTPAAPSYFGGGSFAPPMAEQEEPEREQVTLDADGKLTLHITPSEEDIKAQIDSSDPIVTIDMTTDKQADRIVAQLNAEAVNHARTAGKTFTFQGAQASVSLPADALDRLEADAVLQFSMTKESLAHKPASAVSVSDTIDFAVFINDTVIHRFNKPVEATFRVQPDRITRSHQTGIYMLDPIKQSWVFTGGQLDAANTSIRTSLEHFSTYTVLDFNKSFSDIQQHWAQIDIEKMIARQVVNGMSEDRFEPEASVTRAQFIALLTRAMNIEKAASEQSGLFHDVPLNAWYHDAVYAGYEAKLISGVSEHQFAPDEVLTREQMAVMMVNAYLYAKGLQLSDIVTTQEVKFADEGAVSSWARSYVRIASALGLMNEAESGQFKPLEKASRAQAATVISRLLEK